LPRKFSRQAIIYKSCPKAAQVTNKRLIKILQIVSYLSGHYYADLITFVATKYFPMPETAQLKIGDKTYELPVIDGTEGEKAIDISKLRDLTGLCDARHWL